MRWLIPLFLAFLLCQCTAAPSPPAKNPRAKDASTEMTEPQDHGLGAFAVPPPMEVGRWYNVEFLVAPNAQGLKEEAAGKSTEASKDIYTAPRMRVTLVADEDFKVVAKTPEVQALGLDKSATWQWNVSPSSGGDLELTAHVAPLDAQGENLDDYTKYVTVHARVGGYQSFLSGVRNATSAGDVLTALFKSWREALVALAALIAAAFVVRRVIKNRGADTPPPPPSAQQ